jgi:hypothetical protein
MLPNFKMVIGAIVFAVIALALAGAGGVNTDTYTRIGEMPEVARPMMQQMRTDEPGQAQFHILTLTRRAEELGRLRNRVAQETAAELAFARIGDEPAVVKPAVIEDTAPEQGPGTFRESVAPGLRPSGAMGTVLGTMVNRAAPDPNDLPATPPAAGGTNMGPVAVLAPEPEKVDPPEALPRLQAVLLPRPRPAKTVAVHRRIVHRVHRDTQIPPGTYDVFGQTGYQPRLGGF